MSSSNWNRPRSACGCCPAWTVWLPAMSPPWCPAPARRPRGSCPAIRFSATTAGPSTAGPISASWWKPPERAPPKSSCCAAGRKSPPWSNPCSTKYSGRRLIGIQFNTLSDLDYATRTHPTPWAQVKSHAGSIFRFCARRPRRPPPARPRGAVGGPVLIPIMLWLMAQPASCSPSGSRACSTSTAILNLLLPVPILDGGHVVMNLYEHRRRPPPPWVVNALANVFAAVLFIALFPRPDLPRQRAASAPAPAPLVGG